MLFFRAGASSQQRQRRPDPQQRPNTSENTGKNKSIIKGGDYIDYEEVK